MMLTDLTGVGDAFLDQHIGEELDQRERVFPAFGFPSAFLMSDMVSAACANSSTRRTGCSLF